MVLREDAVPVVQPTRRVPYALKKPLKKELDQMNAANIIEKVEEPSDWCVPGSKLVVSDTLSRISSREQPEKGTADVEVHAVGALTAVVGPATLSRLQAATANDATAQDVISRLQSSMPIEVSSSRFPRSNGLAEKGVQVVKRLLGKTETKKEDFYLGIHNYRVRPLEDGRSPSELLMGRSLRTLLPDFSVSSSDTERGHGTGKLFALGRELGLESSELRDWVERECVQARDERAKEREVTKENAERQQRLLEQQQKFQEQELKILELKLRLQESTNRSQSTEADEPGGSRILTPQVNGMAAVLIN
ncbi:uncharacterized protein LOC125941140 [Dermacentor silvarum]|uniref:uncharacterized protein LOC125941140 n=1 Tax=Dermacentor silvarum TaxID=543639 RepID=UPI0021006CED|nr:uncharacterized protein LOC125941140 [Dermacentor silvarum]